MHNFLKTYLSFQAYLYPSGAGGLGGLGGFSARGARGGLGGLGAFGDLGRLGGPLGSIIFLQGLFLSPSIYFSLSYYMELD